MRSVRTSGVTLARKWAGWLIPPASRLHTPAYPQLLWPSSLGLCHKNWQVKWKWNAEGGHEVRWLKFGVSPTCLPLFSLHVAVSKSQQQSNKLVSLRHRGRTPHRRVWKLGCGLWRSQGYPGDRAREAGLNVNRHLVVIMWTTANPNPCVFPLL